MSAALKRLADGLLGLVYPHEGEAVLTDVDGSETTISAATRSAFSYVPQGNTIFAGTIADNLRMVARGASEDEIVEALKISCAWDFVEKLPNGIQMQFLSLALTLLLLLQN